jgi:hypothetical protein
LICQTAPTWFHGISLRDWFAGQALANPAICNGDAQEWEIKRWFGPHRTGITRAEIVAKQAGEYADAMIAARKSQEPA